MSGWQMDPATRDWHYHPPAGFYGFSACTAYQLREDLPVLPEPESILICQPCVKAMKRMVKQIERKRSTEPSINYSG